MEIYKDRALIVNTKNPESIIEKIKKSKVIASYPNGVYSVAVHWGVNEIAHLTSLRLKNVPSRIKKDYTWPGVFKPFNTNELIA